MKELKPGMVIQNPYGYWIVIARTDTPIGHDGTRVSTSKVDGVMFLVIDEAGRPNGFGWEMRLDSAVWKDNNMYTVVGYEND